MNSWVKYYLCLKYIKEQNTGTPDAFKNDNRNICLSQPKPHFPAAWRNEDRRENARRPRKGLLRVGTCLLPTSLGGLWRSWQEQGGTTWVGNLSLHPSPRRLHPAFPNLLKLQPGECCNLWAMAPESLTSLILTQIWCGFSSESLAPFSHLHFL